MVRYLEAELRFWYLPGPGSLWGDTAMVAAEPWRTEKPQFEACCVGVCFVVFSPDVKAHLLSYLLCSRD